MSLPQVTKNFMYPKINSQFTASSTSQLQTTNVPKNFS